MEVTWILAIAFIFGAIGWIKYWQAARTDRTLDPITPQLGRLWRNPKLRVSVLIPMLISGACIVLLMFILATKNNT